MLQRDDTVVHIRRNGISHKGYNPAPPAHSGRIITRPGFNRFPVAPKIHRQRVDYAQIPQLPLVRQMKVESYAQLRALARMLPMRLPELNFGPPMKIAGVDEAGRGPLAGPVVAAAVVFEEGYANEKIRDSKQLSAQKREQLVERIKGDAVAWAIVAVGHERIRALNILQATRLAMRLAVARIEADLVLVDGNTRIDIPFPQRTVVGGDRLHVQISAASILAKTFRDQLMQVLEQRYPGYGLGTHMGYGTSAHREAIIRLGPSRVHRVTFAGVRGIPHGGTERLSATV